MTLSVNAIAPTLSHILNPEQVLAADGWTERWQHHINLSCLGTMPEALVLPQATAELAAVVSEAQKQDWRILVAGQGTKLSWGHPSRDIALVVSTQKLNRLIDHAVGDMTVTVEAGMRFADLQALLAEQRQWLPLDPAYPAQATLGGILSTRDAGSLRHRYGSLRDLCLGLSFVRADGQVAKAGGRVVKNVAGYDLMKLFSGAYGTLGIVTELTLRVYPMLSDTGTVAVTGIAAAVAEMTQELLQSVLTPVGVDLWASSQTDDLTLLVQFQSLPESVLAQIETIQVLARSRSLTATVLANPESGPLEVLPEEILCQVGVLSAESASSLEAFRNLAAAQSLSMQGRIHAGSGLGTLQLGQIGENSAADEAVLSAWRAHCKAQGGFLTILEAPVALKQSLDVWGYSGSALNAMRKLKEHFDPQGLLNPGRFVGGI